jgi:hypothetical protein
MKLGKLQKKWVASLKAHPERQMSWQLGAGTKRKYKACCLGEAGLIMDSCKFKNGILVEKKTQSSGVLKNSYKKMGLYTDHGGIGDGDMSLAKLNDDGETTWPEIAYMIEAAPELFFTKSV